MKKIYLFLLSILSGLLLAVSWFPNGFTPFIFISFVPLLIVEQHIYNNAIKARLLFLLAYTAFFLWNILVTWWVKNASLGGAAMAIICNALLMALVFLFFHQIKKRINQKYSPLIFICFWLTFEWLHHDWDLSWPWLTLGNNFANTPDWIQWYEYTGVFGGSLWILVVNALIFKFFLKQIEKREKAIEVTGHKLQLKNLFFLLSIILIPILLSLIVKFFTTKYSKGGIKIVIVQPNIDPYNEKFFSGYKEQLEKMLTLANQQIDSTTDYLLFPETALTEDIWENQMTKSSSIHIIKEYLKKYPKLKIITGANTAKIYDTEEKPSNTARKFSNEDTYYDAYNTALQIDSSNNLQIYHKSKLVPGVEKMPFPFLFKYFENFAIDLGGTAGSLGIQNERTVFYSNNKNVQAAPVICYESIYGNYVSDYIKNGATFITIITNDGWWGNTPGYKQHLKYGTLRAIETRKWIARSANTGISCFINPLGEIIQPTNWWEPAVISQYIEPNNSQTFYTRRGDYIAKVAYYSSILLILYSLLIRFKILKK